MPARPSAVWATRPERRPADGRPSHGARQTAEEVALAPAEEPVEAARRHRRGLDPADTVDARRGGRHRCRPGDSARHRGDVAQLRTDRCSTYAVLLSDAPKHDRSSGDKVSATVRCTTPDGSSGTGSTLVGTGLKAGTRVVVGQDNRGTLTTAPPSAREAAVEAGTPGTAAGPALTGAVLGVGAVVRWRLDRQLMGRSSQREPGPTLRALLTEALCPVAVVPT